ncbi:hypothetical protein ESCO_000811 [Escovopsis weberi]|uniref:Uncharacterized protein n=1 Tax=Escovopsis weberi TaxID=150374 RepID=A0A0N0RTH2_ESCWE|nr:hypothetical protein ESCO_000811 [Escovopsis weberi]
MASASYYDVGEFLAPSGVYSPHSRHTSRSRPKERRLHSRSRSRSRSHRRSTRSDHHSPDDHRSSSKPKPKPRGPFFTIASRLSRSTFFGGRPSYYKRSPRKGFLHRTHKQLRRLLRDLSHYARRHPWKVLALVVVPLLGSLLALLARFGLRAPAALEDLLGLAARAATGDPIGAVGDAVRMAGGFGATYQYAIR